MALGAMCLSEAGFDALRERELDAAGVDLPGALNWLMQHLLNHLYQTSN